MEIIVELNSFSYYHSSRIIYITGEILEFDIIEKSSTNCFANIEKGQKLNFKSSKIDIEKIIGVLTNKIVFLKVTNLEEPRDSRQSAKFIFDSIKKCAILPEN